jgi:hypothetical protein
MLTPWNGFQHRYVGLGLTKPEFRTLYRWEARGKLESASVPLDAIVAIFRKPNGVGCFLCRRAQPAWKPVYAMYCCWCGTHLGNSENGETVANPNVGDETVANSNVDDTVAVANSNVDETVVETVANSHVDETVAFNAGWNSYGELTKPTQRWIRITRKILGVKPPTRRGS